MNKGRLIFDRFDIYDGEGTIISDFQSELLAFKEIDSTLKKNEEILQTYIVKGNSCEHFKSYNNRIHGLKVDIITPVCEVDRITERNRPVWLTDKKICDWDLLNKECPTIDSDDDWETIIVSWLLPGLKEINNLKDWFDHISIIEKFPKEFNEDFLFDRIVEKFREIAKNDVPEYILDELVKNLIEVNDPVLFTKEWMFKKAIVPFIAEPNLNPLFSEEVKDKIRISELPITNALPFVFPLI